MKPPPKNHRYLRKGELTQAGDLGFLNGEWRGLYAVHVVNQRIVRPGRVVRKKVK